MESLTIQEGGFSRTRPVEFQIWLLCLLATITVTTWVLIYIYMPPLWISKYVPFRIIFHMCISASIWLYSFLLLSWTFDYERVITTWFRKYGPKRIHFPVFVFFGQASIHYMTKKAVFPTLGVCFFATTSLFFLAMFADHATMIDYIGPVLSAQFIMGIDLALEGKAHCWIPFLVAGCAYLFWSSAKHRYLKRQRTIMWLSGFVSISVSLASSLDIPEAGSLETAGCNIQSKLFIFSFTVANVESLFT